MSEQWVRWEPIQNLAQRYSIESISDTLDGFKIVLFEENAEQNKLQIFFDNSVDAYRSTYESFRQKIINDLHEKYGQSFYVNWSFFKINNSSYVQWLSEESYGITDMIGVMHFSIVTKEEIVDIIACYQPDVKLLEL